MSSAKRILAWPLGLYFRCTASSRESLRRLRAFARLAADLHEPLPSSVVVLGTALVYGSGRVRFGQHCLLYPMLHLETQGHATIDIGDGCVFSRGVHLVAMAGMTIGAGTMIGEYASVRDANHLRRAGVAMRDSGHTGRPVSIGKEVWIGRGVTVLAGVTIGDGATIGANAVVTRDVAAGDTVAGVPARSILKRTS